MKDKRDFMDKTNSFLEEMEKAGISISNQDGETAVICEDCVAVISKSGDKVAVGILLKGFMVTGLSTQRFTMLTGVKSKIQT